MRVLPKAKEHSDKIIADLNADPAEVDTLIEDLHVKGPWAFADRLSASADPATRAYIVLAATCHESAWPGYSEPEYLEDRARVMTELSSFEPQDLDAKKEKITRRLEGFKDLTTREGDKLIKVAIAEGDPALPLAIKGYKGCVTKAGEMRFAQAEEIPDALLEQKGLVKGFGEVYDPALSGFKRVSVDTPKCRVIWVKSEEAGKDFSEMQPAVKRISSGYVLTYKDEALALDLVKTAVANVTQPSEADEPEPILHDTQAGVNKALK